MWLSRLFRRNLVCAVCGASLQKASELKAEYNGPLGKYIESGTIIPFSERLAYQCPTCKIILCPAHTKQIISQMFSYDTCSACGAPVKLVE